MLFCNGYLNISFFVCIVWNSCMLDGNGRAHNFSFVIFKNSSCGQFRKVAFDPFYHLMGAKKFYRFLFNFSRKALAPGDEEGTTTLIKHCTLLAFCRFLLFLLGQTLRYNHSQRALTKYNGLKKNHRHHSFHQGGKTNTLNGILVWEGNLRHLESLHHLGHLWNRPKQTLMSRCALKALVRMRIQ